MQENILDNEAIEDNAFKLNLNSIGYLKEIGKWSKFFAILGFIFTFFAVIGGFSMMAMGSMLGSEFGELGAGFGPMLGLFYIVFAAFYAYPSWQLYQFSSKVKTAISYKNNEDIEEAFSRLKSVFRFTGIITIIFIALYAMILLGVMIGGVSSIMSL